MNATLPDDGWNAPAGLAIGLLIPLGICGIPCAFVTWAVCITPGGNGGIGPASSATQSDSNMGMAMAFPMICFLWCVGAAIGAVALGFGLVSIASYDVEDPAAEAPGLALTIGGAVMLCMPCICFLLVLSRRIVRCSFSVASYGAEKDRLQCASLFGSIGSACCYVRDVTRSERRRSSERDRRREVVEEGGDVEVGGDAEEEEEAANLPESAHDAAAISGWAKAATARSWRAARDAEEVEASIRSEPRDEQQEAEKEQSVTTLAEAKPPGLGRRGTSGSTMVDAMLQSVGLGALAGELGDVFVGGGSPRDRGGGGGGSQVALRRERTRSLLQAGAPVTQNLPSVELAEQQLATEQAEVEVSIVKE